MCPLIPQSRPDLKRDDFAYIREILETGQVAGGRLVAQLEEAFRRCVRTRYAASVSSGTGALQLGLLALGVGSADDVVAPSYTCASVIHAIQETGARVRLADIDEETLNLSRATVRRRLTRRTKALIVTHTFGFPGPLDELRELGVPVVEDCAQALGATYEGRPVGSVGIFSIFSMYATKVICAGEGGMLCTNDPRINRRIRDLNGPDQRTRWRPHRYNYKLSDLTAGLALSQLRRLPAMVARREAIAVRYREGLKGCPVKTQQPVAGAKPNYYRFVVRTPRAAAVISRARRAGIGCDAPVFQPMHWYLNGRSRGEFPVTEAVSRMAVSVPIYPALRETEAIRIATRMRKILSG